MPVMTHTSHILQTNDALLFVAGSFSVAASFLASSMHLVNATPYFALASAVLGTAVGTISLIRILMAWVRRPKRNNTEGP